METQLSDDQFYKIEFEKYQSLTKKYKIKYSGMVNKFDCSPVFKSNIIEGDSPYFKGLCVLKTVFTLFKHGINCEVHLDSICVDGVNKETAIEILNKYDAYNFKYCRRKEDVNLLEYDYS